MKESWIADRMQKIDASGIRKVFDLAANMKDPVNLSIGQPHFDTPQPIKDALYKAVEDGKNAYSQTQGIAPLLQRLQADVDQEYGHADRKVFVSSGTSGALMLAISTLVNPGEEVIIFDPFFVMYKHLVSLAGGVPVMISTYPDFDIDIGKVEAAINDKTKLIICNSPANPTGRVGQAAEMEALAKLAKEKEIVLVSDEIYRSFCYDSEFVSPAKWNDETIVIDGFSKSHSMTGWRLGYVHGPQAVLQQMIKLQQFTFVCAPHPVQWAGLSALDYDISPYVDEYKAKRDFMLNELGNDYDIRGADGAFYMFVKAPWGTGTEFVKKAIENNLLIIPGNVFSSQDSHFRISYAAEQKTLERGVEILKKIVREG
ncbi:MAG: aspartate aminotransferase [Planctomyces sp.]|nr:aspartate aminotransferase [Planctomyces sp.]